MNRIDRVTAILIQLQSRKIVRAQDIADRFRISLRTVYRDISTLCEAGVPIISEAGVGYSIMDGYRLPPVMFTREEAMAFLTAEKLVERFTDDSIQQSFQSAMYKVRSVLRRAEKDMLENLEPYIAVQQRMGSSPEVIAYLQPILKSVTDKKCLQIRYKSMAEEETGRLIEPIGIFYAYEVWHTIAFCRLRQDYRDFRLDRIQQATHTQESFGSEHPSLKEYLQKLAERRQLETAVIRVHPSVARYLSYQKYNYGLVQETTVGNWVEMTFFTSSLEGFARWYLMFADKARIVSPTRLQHLVYRLISGIADSHQ